MRPAIYKCEKGSLCARVKVEGYRDVVKLEWAEKTLLVSDVATSYIKLASGLSSTQTHENSYHDKLKLTNFRPSFRKQKTTKLDIYIPQLVKYSWKCIAFINIYSKLWSISLKLCAETETFHLEQSFVARPKQTRLATELLVHIRVKTHERTLEHTSLWLGRKTQRFSSTNPMPEQLRPFGTSLVRQCLQGLFCPDLESTHSPWVSEDACTWKISSVGKDQFKNGEFCLWKIRPIVCLHSDSTYVFILSGPTHFTIFIRSVDPFIFIH